MIDVHSVEFGYRDSDFHLSIPKLKIARGEKVAIIGPGGCGKTTLLNLIGGIIVPDEGTVCVGGIAVSQLTDAQRRDFRIANTGFVFQDFGLLDYLNTLDNILHMHRITRSLRLNSKVRRRAITLAAQTGIGTKLKARPGDLSQGEKRSTSVCRALLHRPAIILADEATANLDPLNKGRILDVLFECAHRSQATLLSVTHDYDLLECFDRTVDFNKFRRKGPA